MFEVKKEFNIINPIYDCVVVVADLISDLIPELNVIRINLLKHKDCYPKLESTSTLIPFDDHPSKKLIFSPVLLKNDDYDDSRIIYEASNAGMKMAIELGYKRPLLVCGGLKMLPVDKPWAIKEYVEINLVLGAMFAAYVPLEIREDIPKRANKIDFMGVFGISEKSLIISLGLEEGRKITRDISGSDPERMAAPNIEKYILEQFQGTCIRTCIEHVDKTKYPLMAAVNRAASVAERYDGRVVKLEYDSNDRVEETIFLIGKGITYDSGGADVKINGAMSGMHRDKSGAAAITGFFKTLDILKPKKIRVVGLCGYVRNGIGEESYVSDEIITSRSKKRVRVGNTDAEGRMVMADLLCEAKEMALTSINPSLFTIATLTGHVRRTYGLTYTAVMGNGYSCERNIPKLIQEAGDLLAEPFEISTIRREDVAFHQGFREYDDILQCNTKPSVDNSRGHQSPAAFLILASGLDQHTKISEKPLPYTHLDIAGSGGKIGSLPTAVPLLTFAARYILPRLI